MGEKGREREKGRGERGRRGGERERERERGKERKGEEMERWESGSKRKHVLKSKCFLLSEMNDDSSTLRPLILSINLVLLSCYS